MKPPTCSRCGVPFENGAKACTCRVFRTITGEDWRASLAHARKWREKSVERIRNQINQQKP